MSDLITINIDGKNCQAKESETILNIARANGIFVPAICYLTRCSPTLACRLCLVEADGKQVYSCNAKAKDGMVIKTTTENIEKERTAIMEVYDVNHPLQCGVCDQSGECELQNYNLYQKVEKQNYAIKDMDRQAKKWGVMKYDPALCIVCEKCVTVCKDMIGSNALGTVKRGGEDLDKGYKENMPKDAYAMWNKLNKSLIGFEEDKCIDCGECISVCPVGALVSSDFQYKSNAWELTRIPASNPFSSDCSLMYYEIKHESIENNTQQKIYRVTNDSHYTSLSGAARFGFDYSNLIASKDESILHGAIEAIKNARTIKFNSFITNEEAKILQKLKEKLGVKLVNEDALAYQNFLKDFSSVSGNSLYLGNLKDIHNSNFVVSVGSYFKSDAPSVRYAFNNAISMNKGAGLYFHPMNDTTVEGFGKKGKTIETVCNNVGSEEAVMYLLLDKFATDLPSNVQEYINSFKETRTKTITESIKEKVVEKVVDDQTGETKEVTKMVAKTVETQVEYTYSRLLELIGSNEALLTTIDEMIAGKDRFSLIVGQDLIVHPQSKNLAKLCGMLEKYSAFQVIIIPTQTNTLGVSLLCDLDTRTEGSTVGYNEKADFVLSALGDGDIDMPALNQQEGTFVNIDKKVVPTNAGLPYKGYTLNDIANCILDDKTEYTIDYTKEIFEGIEFDKLANYFSNDFKEHRGYELASVQTISNDDVSQIVEMTTMEGVIVCNANPINQFNDFTAVAKQLDGKVALYLSSDLMAKLELNEQDTVIVEANGLAIELEVVKDVQLAGDIAYVPTYSKNIDSKKLFVGARYAQANIKKV